MKFPHHVDKPQIRSALRKVVGREFYIAKRRLDWWLGERTFAKVDHRMSYENSLIRHKSMLLRPLKNVDMYLQHNKITNLRLAIGRIHKAVLHPGQTLSIWRLVGRPTQSKGYLEGMVLHNGRISKGIGGGLCQLGNLLYWMALHTPLTITERWRHSYDVFPDINRSIPFACGATLSYNYIDLQITNTTTMNFQINLWLCDEFLHGEITCDRDLQMKFEVYETDHSIKQQSWGGYTRHNRIWKRITDLADNSSSEEFVTENNAIMMYSPLLGK